MNEGEPYKTGGIRTSSPPPTRTTNLCFPVDRVSRGIRAGIRGISRHSQTDIRDVSGLSGAFPRVISGRPPEGSLW